jgi:diamine N-acetyltransferase
MLQPVRLSEENLRSFMDLRVREPQRGWIAPNSETIAQAHYKRRVYLRGLADSKHPVGLLSMVDFGSDHRDLTDRDPRNVAYLWRLMIHGDLQGRGYGSEAMQLVMRKVLDWGRTSLQTFVHPENGTAIRLYERFGLEMTGFYDDGEAEMVLSRADLIAVGAAAGRAVRGAH